MGIMTLPAAERRSGDAPDSRLAGSDRPERPWTVAPSAPQALHAALPGLHPVAVQVLHTRGLTSPEAISTFLHADSLHDPAHLLGMDKAVDRLRTAIARGEKVAVHGDFDVDGVTSTAVLTLGLRAAGLDVLPHLPTRSTVGYGFHPSIVDAFHAQGISLIVTGDTGTRAIAAVERAAQLGVDVIVTDHHVCGEALPAAHAVVNPQQSDCTYPFKSLSGCGVAWKLVDALARAGLTPSFDPVSLLDLVALGTIVDVSPLTGENRWLVRRGLKRLTDSPRPGIRALLGLAARDRSAADQIDERTVAFTLGPRLNAAGRLDQPGLAFDLLMAGDDGTAFELARQLDSLNLQRQQITEDVMTLARSLVRGQEDQPLLIVRSDTWPARAAGVLGLVASKLADDFARPAIVVDAAGDAARGSARSHGALDLISLLGGCSDLLLEFGGHTQAAGFACETAHLEALIARLLGGTAADLAVGPAPVVADHRLIPADLTWDLYEGLRCLRPFGAENAQPTFLTEGIHLLEARTVGSEKKHLRARFRLGPQTITAFGPNLGYRAAALSATSRVDALYALETSTWNGTTSLELRLVDVRPTAQPTVRSTAALSHMLVYPLQER